VFDFQYSREKLEAEMIEYVEREVGQFYAGDFSTILLRLKNDISSALREQAVSLAHTITNLESNLSVAIGGAVADSFSKIASFGSVVEKPLKDWGAALDMAAAQQAQNDKSLERFEEITANLKSTSDVFAAALHRHITSLAGELSAIDKQITKLSESGVALKDSNDNVKDMISVLQEQSRYIESNQAALRDSLTHYEQSLESITQKMGDGFGSIVDYHMAGAAQAMNTALHANVKAITSSSQEQTTRLEGLFAQLAEQSKNETAAIINMNDQLNVRLDAIESKTI
jgi:chromosome segregation ATPase